MAHGIICWILKATNTHSEYVILIFPPQQRSHERASMLRYTYIACLVPFNAFTCTYSLQWPVGAPVWLPPFAWCSVVRQENNYGVFEHLAPLECLYNPTHRLVQLWDHSCNITVIHSFALLGCWRGLVIGYRSFSSWAHGLPRMRPIYCPETLAANYHSMPRNFPEEGRPWLHRGGPETSLHSILISAWCTALWFVAFADPFTQPLVVSRQLCSWVFDGSVC